MRLYRDVVYKRNIHGYVEESRVQIYQTYVRQIQMWVVYYPYREQYDLSEVTENGLYFLDVRNLVNYLQQYYRSFVTNQDFLGSVDMVQEVINAVYNAYPKEGELMYRVVYRCPNGEIEEWAIGPNPYNSDEPWFVNPNSRDTAKWCIYNQNLGKAVMHMSGAIGFGGYILDRIRFNPDGGVFVLQATQFHPSGIPVEGDVWADIESTPVWYRNACIELTEDCLDYNPVSPK